MPLDPTQRLRNLANPDNGDPNNVRNAIQGVADQSLQGSLDSTGYDRLLGLSNYPTPALNAYQQFLANPPNPADYKPSIGRRIGGAIAGGLAGASSRNPLMGYEIAQDITNRPMQRAQQGFDVRAKQLGQAADIEEKKISGEARIASAESRAQSAEDMMRIRQQQANIQAKKEQDIFETKRREDAQKLQKMQDDLDYKNKLLAEKQREFEGRQGNFQDQLALHKLQLDVTDATHKLQIAQRERALDEQKRLHDMEKVNWDRQRGEAEQRIKDMEAAQAAKTGGTETTVTKEEVPQQGMIGKLFSKVTGYEPTGKTTKTTTVKQPIGKIAQQRVKVKGPNGESGTVTTDDAKHLPSGWTVIQ